MRGSKGKETGFPPGQNNNPSRNANKKGKKKKRKRKKTIYLIGEVSTAKRVFERKWGGGCGKNGLRGGGEGNASGSVTGRTPTHKKAPG